MQTSLADTHPPAIRPSEPEEIQAPVEAGRRGLEMIWRSEQVTAPRLDSRWLLEMLGWQLWKPLVLAWQSLRDAEDLTFVGIHLPAASDIETDWDHSGMEEDQQMSSLCGQA